MPNVTPEGGGGDSEKRKFDFWVERRFKEKLQPKGEVTL